MKLAFTIVLAALTTALTTGALFSCRADPARAYSGLAEPDTALYERYRSIVEPLERGELPPDDELVGLMTRSGSPSGLGQVAMQAALDHGSPETVTTVVDGMIRAIDAIEGDRPGEPNGAPPKTPDESMALRESVWFPWFTLVEHALRGSHAALTNDQAERIIERASDYSGLSINLQREMVLYLSAAEPGARRSRLARKMLLARPPGVLDAPARLGVLLEGEDIEVVANQADALFGNPRDSWRKSAFLGALAASRTAEGREAIGAIAARFKGEEDLYKDPRNRLRDRSRIDAATAFIDAEGDARAMLTFWLGNGPRLGGLRSYALEAAVDWGASSELVRELLEKQMRQTQLDYAQRLNEAAPKGSEPLLATDPRVLGFARRHVARCVAEAERLGFADAGEVLVD